MQSEQFINPGSTADASRASLRALDDMGFAPEPRATPWVDGRGDFALPRASDGEDSTRQAGKGDKLDEACARYMTSKPFGLLAPIDGGKTRPATDDEIIAVALLALDAKIRRQGSIASPADARAFVSLRLAHLAHEVFAVMFVDARHRIIEFREMFRGTLTQTAIYPREVVKEALALNAGAVILTHNHPSGDAEPSLADELLTQTLKNALALVDVQVLDHLVVGGGRVVSFAERGLL